MGHRWPQSERERKPEGFGHHPFQQPRTTPPILFYLILPLVGALLILLGSATSSVGRVLCGSQTCHGGMRETWLRPAIPSSPIPLSFFRVTLHRCLHLGRVGMVCISAHQSARRVETLDRDAWCVLSLFSHPAFEVGRLSPCPPSTSGNQPVLGCIPENGASRVKPSVSRMFGQCPNVVSD